MRAKINRSGSWLSYDLANLVPGRKIDAEVLEDLETRLLSADVGVEATEQILEELRKKVARKELDDVDKLIAALTDAITAILLPVQKPLKIRIHSGLRADDHVRSHSFWSHRPRETECEQLFECGLPVHWCYDPT